MSDWKDLNINNIPEFVNDAVKVQKFVRDGWINIQGLKSSIVYDVVEPTISTKYRYATKTLKPLMINQE